jgi:hypothetical protein
MNFLIDITESFGAIDFDNAGGVISYINIPPTENIHNSFQLEIFNVVLNLIDEPVVSSIKLQNSKSLENMDEDGFLILNKAIITFEKIKGHEKLIRLLNQDEGYLTHESYGPKLANEDKIYDVGGRSFSTPQLLINLAIISPKKVTIEFTPSNHTYIATYEELQNSVELLNLQANRVQPPILGIFDTTYSNMHTVSDFDAGYRVYKQ